MQIKLPPIVNSFLYSKHLGFRLSRVLSLSFLSTLPIPKIKAYEGMLFLTLTSLIQQITIPIFDLIVRPIQSAGFNPTFEKIVYFFFQATYFTMAAILSKLICSIFKITLNVRQMVIITGAFLLLALIAKWALKFFTERFVSQKQVFFL